MEKRFRDKLIDTHNRMVVNRGGSWRENEEGKGQMYCDGVKYIVTEGD